MVVNLGSLHVVSKSYVDKESWKAVATATKMRIKLTNDERELLLSRVRIPQHLAAVIHQAEYCADNWILNISEEDADTIRDLCGETLQEIGFDKEYNPTHAGRILECLIDKFFIG